MILSSSLSIFMLLWCNYHFKNVTASSYIIHKNFTVKSFAKNVVQFSIYFGINYFYPSVQE